MLLIDSMWCELVDNAEDESSTCYGYKRNILKTFLFVFLCVVTGGMLALVTYWKPEWRLKLTHTACLLTNATAVLIIDQHSVVFVVGVEKTTSDLAVSITDNHNYSYFWYKHHKFCYHYREGVFKHVEGVDGRETLYGIHHHYQGIHVDKRSHYLDWYGKNSIDVKVKSIATLFFEESADPFYIFQIFSCILWFMEDYYYYAVAIVFVSLGSIVISIFQTRKHLQTLRNMIAKSGDVQVLLPSGEIEEVRNPYANRIYCGDQIFFHRLLKVTGKVIFGSFLKI